MTRKPQRRSIVSNFGAFSAVDPSPNAVPQAGPAVAASGEGAPPSLVRPFGEPVARVGAGIIGATQRTLTDIREERDRLRALVEAGGVFEIDPSLVDPSPFPDRLPDDDASAFEAFKQTIAEEGQKVPVEVRRHPVAPGRYQLVYGHRRWRAAQDLGLVLRAFVVDLDDKGLVIAQGIENSVRQDLSWIEKAQFAYRMDQAGIRARDIRAALMVDDPELARFRAVCRTLGLESIVAIGRAPKAGRPRWVELAALVVDRPDGLAKLKASLAAAKDLNSNDRFLACLAALTGQPARERQTLHLQGAGGARLGSMTLGSGAIQIRVEKSVAGELLAFFEREIPALMNRFASEYANVTSTTSRDDKRTPD